jgi:uncharacterized protein with GYD domain
MTYYILLNKFTDQGARTGKDLPARIREAQKEAEKHGSKLTVYTTFGEYDTVSMLEAPNDETAFSIISNIVSLGNVKTTTLKAFTLEELEKMLSGKPS